MVSTNPIEASATPSPAAPSLAREDGARDSRPRAARGPSALVVTLRALAALAAVAATLPVFTDGASVEVGERAVRVVDANATWFVTGASALVLLSFASGSRRLPFGAWTAAHLGLWLMLGGATIHLTNRNFGTLELRPGEPAHDYASPNGRRALPFSLAWEAEANSRSAPPTPAAPSSSVARARRREVPAATGTNPYPGRLRVQWPARTVSVCLPVQIGHAPLLVAPGESPNPSNSFRIVFLRLVPDFVMNPETHEVAARSDAPVNPALQVREIGPGYAREHWLFGRFPGMGQHPEIHAGRGMAEPSSPLRLRYEVDVPEEPAEPVILAEAEESAALAALVHVETAAPRPASEKMSTLQAVPRPYRLTLREPGRTAPTEVHLDPAHPWRHGGFSFRMTEPATRPDQPLQLEVGETGGAPWVAAGAALSAAGWFRTRRRG